ncbi:MAG TPA: glutathione S-transferase family protein, partial [Solirubrobacterales bacterium]|nr:glutathione S-transferase family protein [Solirubrobacterales bacterium]
MKIRLYGLPGSHPTMAVATMLERKGLGYRRIDLVPFLARAIVRRGMGLPQNTVPVLVVDGRRIQGSREIARELDRLRPDSPLFPDDPERRRAVEEAERWGEEELQHPIRQISLWAMHADRAPIRSYMGPSVMGAPAALAARLAPPFIGRGVRVNEATDEAVRVNLAALDSMLRRVDEWIAAGVLDGEELSAADFQIGASVRLLLTFQDLRPLIEDRPACRLARRAVPDYRGDAPPVFPPAWL